MDKDKRSLIMAELHASKIDFVGFQDGEWSENYLKSVIADFILSREQSLIHDHEMLVNTILEEKNRTIEEMRKEKNEKL